MTDDHRMVELREIVSGFAEALPTVTAAYEQSRQFRAQVLQWCADNGTTLDAVEDRVVELVHEARAQPLTAEARVRQSAEALDIRGTARSRFLSSRS